MGTEVMAAWLETGDKWLRALMGFAAGGIPVE